MSYQWDRVAAMAAKARPDPTQFLMAAARLHADTDAESMRLLRHQLSETQRTSDEQQVTISELADKLRHKELQLSETDAEVLRSEGELEQLLIEANHQESAIQAQALRKGKSGLKQLQMIWMRMSRGELGVRLAEWQRNKIAAVRAVEVRRLLVEELKGELMNADSREQRYRDRWQWVYRNTAYKIKDQQVICLLCMLDLDAVLLLVTGRLSISDLSDVQ